MKKRRNNKKRKTRHEVEVPFPVSLSGVLVVVLVLGLSYMWLCARCDALGKEIKHRESALTAARKRLVNEQDRWSYLTSPANLRRAIQKYGLEMSMPSQDQVVRVRYANYVSTELARN